MAVSIEGGEPREIYTSEGISRRCSSWLPDGRYVFDMRREKDWAKYAIKLDGKSEPVRISDRIGESYAISPNGTKSVFGEREWTSKLWLMSDFLPDNELAMK